MQSLAQGVGDLKKIFTNVKARGTWGEIELGNILQEYLTPDQYICITRILNTRSIYLQCKNKAKCY